MVCAYTNENCVCVRVCLVSGTTHLPSASKASFNLLQHCSSCSIDFSIRSRLSFRICNISGVCPDLIG